MPAPRASGLEASGSDLPKVEGGRRCYIAGLIAPAANLGNGDEESYEIANKKPLKVTYSDRKASIGSTDAARRAGKNAAALAASRNRPVTIRMTGASTA